MKATSLTHIASCFIDCIKSDFHGRLFDGQVSHAHQLQSLLTKIVLQGLQEPGSEAS